MTPESDIWVNRAGVWVFRKRAPFGNGLLISITKIMNQLTPLHMDVAFPPAAVHTNN